MTLANEEKIAAALVGGTPLAYKTYPDGSLVVIGPTGKKCKFTPAQVVQAAEKIKPTSTRKNSKNSAIKQFAGENLGEATEENSKPTPKKD